MNAAPNLSTHGLTAPRRRGAAPRPSWAAQSELIGRGIGIAFLVAGATALVSLVFPPAQYGSAVMAGVVAALATAIGIVLVVIQLRGYRTRPGWMVVGFATATVTLGVYAGGAPESGALLFYLWVIPYAFALSSAAQAAAQAVWMAFCYAGVLAIQLAEHPGIGGIGDLVGLWFIAVVTVVAVGVLVRVLSRSLRDIDRRFDRAFQDSSIGAAFTSLDGHWLEVNDAICRMLGRPREELIGSSLLDITFPEDRELTEDAIARAAAGIIHQEKRYLRPNGEIVWVEVSASFIILETGPPCLFGQYRDITEHKRDRDALAHQAVHDPLTGLYNRALLLDRLENALARHEFVAIILLDLDGFKTVNDSLGHQTGDEVLTVIAPRLQEATHSTDTLARLGGDEFVVLCERLHSPMDAIDRANRLAAAVATPVDLGTGRHTLTASIGVATSHGAPEAAGNLLRDADAAMYRAKAKGRGRIEIFDRTMRDEALERLALERDLQTAVAHNEFVLEYQPIVEAETLRPVALEALLRWNHPERGRLGPDAFIPLAEETGLIATIGQWVLSEACAQLAVWQQAGYPELRLSVNVSPVQLAVGGFAREAARVIRHSRIAPGSLSLEITESSILGEEAPAAALAALKELGLRILLDDFGTGYSSLGYLIRFPIDTLKIDRSFTAELDGTPHSAAITKAILAIAQELGLDVVAEGVENERQLEQLRQLNCPHVQGYVIARPLPASEIPAFLAAQLESLDLAASVPRAEVVQLRKRRARRAKPSAAAG
jgi:diguanylate cyclase (GGDEF)-like protein/PAS domain S-box-containing protein